MGDQISIREFEDAKARLRELHAIIYGKDTQNVGLLTVTYDNTQKLKMIMRNLKFNNLLYLGIIGTLLISLLTSNDLIGFLISLVG